MVNFSKALFKDEDEGIVVVKIREIGDIYFFELELENKSLYSLIKLISVLRKLPDILFRNDKDVGRLRDHAEIDFFRTGKILSTTIKFIRFADNFIKKCYCYNHISFKNIYFDI